MNKITQIELEAAAFRQLIEHLRSHPEIQNIDLMIHGDFCRNCLAKWYMTAAKERGVEMDYEQARIQIYGMPYDEWKQQHQQEATPQQLAAFEQKQQAKANA